MAHQQKLGCHSSPTTCTIWYQGVVICLVIGLYWYPRSKAVNSALVLMRAAGLTNYHTPLHTRIPWARLKRRLHMYSSITLCIRWQTLHVRSLAARTGRVHSLRERNSQPCTHRRYLEAFCTLHIVHS
ncbi:hypothetical protein BDZ91DRAFT_418259 [Kalaharituber pfeilii]|nr:hypothetical protein BDZ91DRAFT_418259 [Kalaharituber pfeilii]